MAFHRNLGALLLGVSLCRACWVSRLPLSAVLQPAHGLERRLGAVRTPRFPPLLSSHALLSAISPKEAASLGGALLRVANALEQKHGSLGDSPRRFRAKPSNREFSGGPRCHFRRSVVSGGVWSFQAWRPGADSEGGENPQGETRGSHSSSRKQNAQRFECPRWRGIVLAQTRRRVPVAAMRQHPQPHAVRRHDRCGPRRRKVGKPAESNCSSSSHSRCAGTGVAGSIPRNGVGMAHIGDEEGRVP